MTTHLAKTKPTQSKITDMLLPTGKKKFLGIYFQSIIVWVKGSLLPALPLLIVPQKTSGNRPSLKALKLSTPYLLSSLKKGCYFSFAGPVTWTEARKPLDALRIINNGEFCRERQRFVGRISSGIIEEIEDQCSSTGPTVSLRINGTF